MSRVIIAKAPLRISFAGGGTDLKEFYKNETGSVTSTAIDKYVYIVVKKYFHNQILLRYSEIEIVDKVEQIKHPLIRESLKLLNITKGIEINSMADIPAGTGIGSSSTFTVALLHALHAFKGEHVSSEQLAREACHVEINLAGHPIGKQDQYISAYGGIKFIEFNPDETVNVVHFICQKETLKKLNENLLLFYTNFQRSANEILKEQKEKTEEKMNTLREMKRLSEKIRNSLVIGDLDKFAEILHEGWVMKRSLLEKISNPIIDEYYDKALAAGAKGGKLLGAGGGGFLLFYCDRDKQDKVRMALSDLREINFKLDPGGSRIIYVGD